MKNIVIKNVSEYIEIISNLNCHHESGHDTQSPYIYRGMSNYEFRLLPSIFRKIKNFDLTINETIENYKYPCNNKEKFMLKSFISKAKSQLPNISVDDYHIWLEYAQHYGVPTRLLDWTTNPLVALFFSCNNAFDCNLFDGRYDENSAVVYILNEVKYREYSIRKNNNNKSVKNIVNKYYKDKNNTISIDYPVVYHTYYIDNRMLSQSGCFMLWGNIKHDLEKMLSERNYISTNLLIEDNYCFDLLSNKDEFIGKIIIDGQCKRKILYDLDLLGINNSFIFPGLDGIGKTIENEFRYKHYI